MNSKPYYYIGSYAKDSDTGIRTFRVIGISQSYREIKHTFLFNTSSDCPCIIIDEFTMSYLMNDDNVRLDWEYKKIL